MIFIEAEPKSKNAVAIKNPKKKRTKQKMQFYHQRKVGLTFFKTKMGLFDQSRVGLTKASRS
jgi:hypothetical protein